MINPGQSFNVPNYEEIFLRRIWFFIIPFVVIIAGTGLYLLVVLKEYRATTLILATPQRVPEDFVRPIVTSRIEERLQSIIGQEITSPARLERIIKDFNLYPEEMKSSKMEAIVATMQKNIEVQTKGRDSGYFTISYIGKDPKTVTLIANKLASLFIEENMNFREQQAHGTSEFLSLELKAIEAKLEEQEKIITDFKRRSFEEERTSQQLPQEIKLAQLKNNLDDLKMKYTEKHPDLLILKRKVAALEKEVEQAKSRMEEEKKREGQPVLTSPAKIKPQISRHQDRVEESFNREQDMAILTRDYQNTREAYSSLLKKSQEAQQAENLERRQKGEQFKIVDPARVPEKPYRPDIPRVLLIGLFLGFACGGAGVFFREQMDRSFRDPEDLHLTFGFKVLANIPRIGNKAS